jgi:argininosuccinate synthase
VGIGDQDEEDDWRMRGPAAKPRVAPFKPGAATWDTDDAKEAARKAGKRGLEEAVATRAEKRAVKGRVNPGAWWAEHYKPRYKESVQTVGHAARSVTSTTAIVTTKNERVQELVHRCDNLPQDLEP